MDRMEFLSELGDAVNQARDACSGSAAIIAALAQAGQLEDDVAAVLTRTMHDAAARLQGVSDLSPLRPGPIQSQQSPM